jgi:hypothetical protein
MREMRICPHLSERDNQGPAPVFPHLSKHVKFRIVNNTKNANTKHPIRFFQYLSECNNRVPVCDFPYVSERGNTCRDVNF